VRDGDRVIGVELAEDLTRAQHRLERLLCPLGFVNPLPDAHPRVVLEAADHLPEHRLLGRRPVFDAPELAQEHPTVEPVARGRVLPLHFLHERRLVPGAAHDAGAQEGRTGGAQFLDPTLTAGRLRFGGRRHGESDRKHLPAVDHEDLIGVDADARALLCLDQPAQARNESGNRGCT